MQELDKISSLPDCLIHPILSLLETKESVRTSFLSKRWTNVWKSAPFLDLNFSDFNQVEKFESFGNSILQHKGFTDPQQLDTFNLTLHACNEESFQIINIWIYILVFLKPKEVLIDVSKLDKVYFVSYLFDCPSLERMFLWPRINGAWAGFEPAIVELPLLKSLNLGWITLEDEFIQRLIAGCPVIQELTLKIAVHLGLVDFENLSNLEHAFVNLYEFNTGYDDLEEFKLLKGLSNAKTLQLSGFYVNKMLKKEVQNSPVFERLERLDLVSFTVNDALDPIDLFLRKTPNVKNLILKNISVENRWVCFGEEFL